MKDETMEDIIDSVNDGSGVDWIFTRPLTRHVRLARVWEKMPSGEAENEASCSFYFIYSGDGLCVAAVYDMGPDDLHVYTKPEWRRRGIMFEALRAVVLPHLFSLRHVRQVASFKSMDGLRLMRKLGFRHYKRRHTVIHPDAFLPFQGETLPFERLGDGRAAAIKRRIAVAALHLRMAREELEDKTESCVCENLGDLERRVHDMSHCIKFAVANFAHSHRGG
ncbi:MAG: hypothetical protein ABJF10_23260 [Chthoniobacter sp.]|uniref:hypothetical protein n=1 Tax=Chthoniobacter sp. TaxID=2510640 RepID=UPI0032AE5FC9